MPSEAPFDLKFTSREVTAWGGLALLKRMLDGMGFKEALQSWDLPQPGSNRGYHPEQLIEQMIVSIWCGAARFAHADITRLDSTLVRLFDWGHAAGHKAIVRLFQRFDQVSATRVQSSSYRWLFDKLQLNPITLDVDSTVLTRWGSQIEGGAKGYNPKNKGRQSHHPLMAFVADWRLVANFWLRPGNTASSNNIESFIESTLENLGATKVGLFRADSGFYDKVIVAMLKAKKISHIISARLTQALQHSIVDQCKWQQVEVGLEVSELTYQPHGWEAPQRLVVVRQHIQRKNGAVAGKTLSLFADDPDLQGWRYGAMLTDLSIPALEVWRLYRGRADCENRIKELKADFGLDSFVLRDFWATEAALGVTMLSYNLMSVFRHAVMRQKVHHTLSTLHHQVLAVGALWDDNSKNTKQTFRLAVARKRRPWFEGLWANAGDPVRLTPAPSNS
jgi:citrate lyase gamma subunit